MLVKGTLAAGLMAVSLAVSPVAAEAKTKVHVGIGIGSWGGGCYGQFRRHCGYGWGHGYRSHIGVYPYYDPYFRRHPRVYYRYNRVTCGEARNILRDRGFHRIRSRDCGGSTYVFTAVKRGHVYRVAISSRSGAIIGTRRI